MRVNGAHAWLMPIMGGLVGTAWAALYFWNQSPYGRYLDHGSWPDLGFTASVCRVLPTGEFVLPAILYAGGWVLMTAAMMLPTVFPLLQRFDQLVGARNARIPLVGLLITGYLLAWLAFGVVAHLLDGALHEAVLRSPWLISNAWILGTGTLATAGVFQFTRWKYRCLDHCRKPLGFIIQHWHGRRQYRDALLIGGHHGLFCVGCCWALMLLMFVVGSGNVGWMLVLGAIMAIEKNARWGQALSQPLGFALLGWAGGVAVVNS